MLDYLPCAVGVYNNDVNDKSTKTPGGLQCIKTIDGYLHPLNIVTGLPYVPLCPLSGDDWTTKTHVIWTSDEVGDPKQLDNTISNKEDWYIDMDTPTEGRDVPPFDEQGNYCHRYEVQFANLPYLTQDLLISSDEDSPDEDTHYSVPTLGEDDLDDLPSLETR